MNGSIQARESTVAPADAPIDAVLPDIILLTLGRGGEIRRWNAEAGTALKLGRGDRLDDLLARIEETDRESLAAAFECVAGGVEPRLRIRARIDRSGDGSRDLAGWLTRQRDEIVFAAHDVSEFRQEGREFREIAESAVEGIVVHRDGRLLFVNQRMGEMLGIDDVSALLNTNILERFLHPEDRATVLSNIAARIAGKPAPRDYEFRLLKTDGTPIWVDCRAGLIEWHGKPAVVATCFDISDQVMAHEARREHEQLFRQVFELSPDIITLSRKSDGTFQFVNEAFLRAFGFEESAVIGRTSRELGIWATPDDRQKFISELDPGNVVRDYELRVLRADGTPFEVSLSATTLNFLGEPYLLMLSRDITEYKRQQRELRHSKESAELANRTKSEFLANISHELRTPLNAIIGFSELMHGESLGALGNETYRGYAGDILEAGRHLLSIINDILDLSKLEAGQLDITCDPVPVANLLEPCLRLIRDRAEQAKLELRSAIPADDLQVSGDERRLKQILINLLSNAVKFTPEGGAIEVGAEHTGEGMVRIYVSDTGIGMSEEEIDKALTPFGQIDSSLARRYEGAGLGLPLVKALAEMQGGRLEIRSTPERGTTVSAFLPSAGA